jgi:hypothetical protein
MSVGLGLAGGRRVRVTDKSDILTKGREHCGYLPVLPRLARRCIALHRLQDPSAKGYLIAVVDQERCWLSPRERPSGT